MIPVDERDPRKPDIFAATYEPAETTPARHETPDLAELRRLAEAATPGPWAARYGVSWEARVCATTGSLADVDSTANAELIAAAVTALPALLDAAAERDALAAKVETVRALADEWAYKGEFGWDDGSHAYGPDCERRALDYAAAKLRRALDGES